MNIDFLKGKKWRKRGRWFYTVLYGELFGEGESTYYSEKLGHPFKKTVSSWLPDGYFIDWLKEWDDTKELIVDLYKKDPDYFQKYGGECLELGQKVIDYANKLQKINAPSLSSEELANIFLEMAKKSKEFMPYMFSLHLVDEFLSEKFEELLKEHVKNNQEKYFEYQTALTVPFKKIFVLEEKEKLMKLAIKEKNDENIDLKKHADEFAWINAVLFENEPHTINYYEEKLNELLKTDVEKEVEQIETEEKRLLELQKKIMEEIKVNEEFYNISKIIQVFGFLRSYRVDVHYVLFGRSWNIIQEISKRIGLKGLEFAYLTSKEISVALIENKNFKETVKKRQKLCITVTQGKEGFVSSDKEKIDALLDILKVEEDEVKDYVKGTIAFPGEIKGVAKVLFNLEDMKKVEKGDILVISMTDPNYIPAMEKASAFVTDFGGILCHAAIVSREMKKPCVIGTKNATKFFKDGDTIEIKDGIVKKI